MPGPLSRHTFAILISVLLFAGFALDVARAEEAGLVIEHGDGSVTYVLIAFPEDEISSIDLLRRSGLSLSTVSSGGLGEAVCSIDSEGCGVEDCRVRLCQTGAADSPFWKFFRVGSTGDWIAQPFGASGTKVRGGEVDLWAWTGVDPAVETIDLSTIVERTSAPVDRPSDGVYVAWFDAAGNLIAPPETQSGDRMQLVWGALLIGSVSVVAYVVLSRRRTLIDSQA